MSDRYLQKFDNMFNRAVSTLDNSPAFVTGSTSNQNSVGNIPMVSQDVLEADGIGDSFKIKSQTSNNNGNKGNAKINKVIYQTLEPLNTKYNLGLTVDNCVEFIAVAKNCDTKKIQTATNEEILSINEHIKTTIRMMEKKNIPVTSANVKIYSCKYTALVNAGWEIQEFEKSKNHESISERMVRYYQKDFTNSTKEERVKLVREYFESTYDSTKNRAEKKDNFKANISFGLLGRTENERNDDLNIFQLTDFAKLAANSTQEECELLYEAIQVLASSDNKYKAVENIYANLLTKESRQAFAEKESTMKTTKEIVMSIDNTTVEGATHATAIARTTLNYQNEKNLQANSAVHRDEAIEFYKENGNKLAEIVKKQQNNIPLTVEEQELLNKSCALKSLSTALSEAPLSSQVILTNSARIEALENINSDTYQISQYAGETYYREVLTQVNQFIEKFSESLNITKEEAVAIMDATSNGNFSRVVADAKNKTQTVLADHSTPNVEAAQNAYKTATKGAIGSGAYKNLEFKNNKPNTATTSNKENKVQEENNTNDQTVVNNSTTNNMSNQTKDNTVQNNTCKANFGFVTPTIKNTNTLEKAKELLEEQNVKPKKTKNLKFLYTAKDLMAMIKENRENDIQSYINENKKDFILNVFELGDSIPIEYKEKALELYEESDNQIDILIGSTMSTFVELLPLTSNKTLLENPNKNFVNNFATDLYQIRLKEVQDKNKENTIAC